MWSWLRRNKKDTTLGQRGEELACRFLKEKGYKLLERNYRCRAGEIDIVAMQGNDLIFVEVKARSSRVFGDPVEAVTPRKQRQISKAALCYLEKHRYCGAARFDVVAILMHSRNAPEIELVQNAFELNYED